MAQQESLKHQEVVEEKGMTQHEIQEEVTPQKHHTPWK
jgi:hypothetical protein